jgi:hypothetical protein
MSGTSTYVQLSNYALIEYIYNSEVITTAVARPFRLYNGYSDQYQFLNGSSAVNITGNVLDRSASRLGVDSSLWAYQDINSTTPIIQIDNKFKLFDETSYILSNQRYDTVRLHLAAGYDFAGIDGVILEIQWEEWAIQGYGGKKFSAGSQVYLKSEPNISYNPDSLFLGDRFYDRYVEFKVPALADVNTDFWNSPTASTTIGYQYTFNNVGFLQSSQIFINLYEIDTTSVVNDNRYFQTGNSYKSSINAADQYSYLGAEVRENVEYDYIEYFPTYYGGFIEDFISDLNAGPGGDWIVINQLNVWEQAGTSLIRTSSSTLLQDSNFNEPSVFRPIIRNAAYVYSFKVEYIMRLMNKVNNSEIIRKATFTSSEPKKYGKSLSKINVLEGFRPVKVYNKIEKIQSSALTNSIASEEGAFGFGTPKIITQNIYVNNYYDINYISVDSTTNVSDLIGENVYPQGMNYIFINKYDNYVKFKIFTKSADKKQNVTLDLASTGMNINLSFIFDDSSKIYLEPTQDMNAANPGAGEVIFRIDDAISTKLLNQVNREYYLINKNPEGDEVLVYHGKYESQDKRNDIIQIINKGIIDDLSKQVAKLKTAKDSLMTQTAPATGTTNVTQAISVGLTSTASPSSQVLQDSSTMTTLAIDKATTFVTNETKGIDNAIKSAATNTTKENPVVSTLNIPDVPGVTPSMGSPISLATQPKVIRPASPNKSGFLYQRLTDGAITDIANNQSI